MMKEIRSARNVPQVITIDPRVRLAFCHAPPGIKNVVIGIRIFPTSYLINAVAATPIILGGG